MEVDRKEKERQITELGNEVKTLNEKLETMDRSLDCHEKCSRGNWLLICDMKKTRKKILTKLL